MIAAAVGVSDKTVGKVRAELEAGAEIPHHETRTGSDGVKQPATKPDPADTPTGSIFDIGDALTKMQVPDRRKAVAELSKEGLSTRKIGEVLGVSKDTVHDDQRATVGNPTPKAKKVAKKADPPVENPTPPDLTATAKTQTRKQRENKAAAKRQDKARREAAVVEVPAAEIRPGVPLPSRIGPGRSWSACTTGVHPYYWKQVSERAVRVPASFPSASTRAARSGCGRERRSSSPPS